MRVGIVGWKTGENSFGITVPYFNFVRKFGEVVVLSPRQIDSSLDLLILPGGPDISPHIYGQEPNLLNSNPDLLREDFFLNCLQTYINNGIPIFGICLGMQQLNVHFGGTLTQHRNCVYSTSGRDQLVEQLVFLDDTIKFPVKVNSLHHQYVMPKNLSEQFDIIATSKEAGNIEAFQHNSLPIAGVQWHPEEIFEHISTQLINSITNDTV